MARWEPDARGRLLQAAVELFDDRGYDATTAAQVAERAGLTKTTLFRHFADKREILFQGQDELVALAVGAVESAPRQSTPYEIARGSVRALCSIHIEERRDIRRRLVTILPSSAELMERAVFKRSAVTEALRSALAARIGDSRRAGVLADAAIRAYYDGYASWVASGERGSLADVVDGELDAFAAALGDALHTR